MTHVVVSDNFNYGTKSRNYCYAKYHVNLTPSRFGTKGIWGKDEIGDLSSL